MYTKEQEIKSLFITYFDGCSFVKGEPNTSNTFEMGVTKLKYNENNNELIVYLRNPVLLIGRSGEIIDKLKKYLKCEITIKEVNLLN